MSTCSLVSVCGELRVFAELMSFCGIEKIQRNNEVLAILQEGSRNIYEVVSRMTWNVDCDTWDSFPVVQSFFATEEAFAHIRYLEGKGEIERMTEGRLAIYSLHEAR